MATSRTQTQEFYTNLNYKALSKIQIIFNMTRAFTHTFSFNNLCQVSFMNTWDMSSSLLRNRSKISYTLWKERNVSTKNPPLRLSN